MADYDPIVWNDSYITGVAEIDDQHRILVNTFNAANAELLVNYSAQLLEQISYDLLSYALYHFETEEKLMQEYGYGEQKTEDANLHTQQHRSFSAKVVAVRDGIKAGNLISREDLLSFLNGWLIQHILNTDKQLASFILARRGAL